MPQLNIKKAIENRDIGIEASKVHADKIEKSWSEKAYDFLINYIKIHKEFMVEEVRQASIDKVPQPPSARAWGAVILKARKSKLIKNNGYRKTKNPKSHRTPATVWQVCA